MSTLPDVDAGFCRRPPLAARLRRLLAGAARALGAAESTLWTYDGDDALAAALNHGPDESVVEAQSVPVTASVVGFVATQGSGMVVGPDDWQNPTVMRATGRPVTAMVAVPVTLGGEVVGVLSAINPAERARFGVEDLAEAAWYAFLIEAVLTHAKAAVPE
ncbi:GAF domain protein (plasmid) [Gemmatirosa kalamazoonensis]|jgi:GAF domain-containing protein|uniref:GAF domain protein n=1 Tax=Gemmatirosa kalamazoonensis TaxID=861299 RepID=W0RSP8_9BACT|nr:GAF domain-containing protein [Gemmatirosa kalamazoonensis]AHG93335.1 GAF domain protein [Gemmatirosa kalamazoonensis]